MTSPCAEILGREINPHVITAAPFTTKALSNDRVVLNVGIGACITMLKNNGWFVDGVARFSRQYKDRRWYPYGMFVAGTMYKLNDTSQLYFDYEYAMASTYERPWSLNLGYRRLW